MARGVGFGTLGHMDLVAPPRNSIRPTRLSQGDFRVPVLVLRLRLQKPLGGCPKPKAARFPVGNAESLLNLPDGLALLNKAAA